MARQIPRRERRSRNRLAISARRSAAMRRLAAPALTRLCLALALTTLYLVAQGVEVVQQGKRRWVDPHWFGARAI